MQVREQRRPSQTEKRGFLTRGEVARTLGCSTSTVRNLEAKRRLVPAEQTPGGVRLFTREAVARLAVERACSRGADVRDGMLLDTPGGIEAAAFQLFEAGVHPVEVVCRLRIASEAVVRFHESWSRLRGRLSIDGAAVARLNEQGMSTRELLAGLLPMPSCAACQAASARFCGGCQRARHPARDGDQSAA